MRCHSHRLRGIRKVVSAAGAAIEWRGMVTIATETGWGCHSFLTTSCLYYPPEEPLHIYNNIIILITLYTVWLCVPTSC